MPTVKYWSLGKVIAETPPEAVSYIPRIGEQVSFPETSSPNYVEGELVAGEYRVFDIVFSNGEDESEDFVHIILKENHAKDSVLTSLVTGEYAREFLSATIGGRTISPETETLTILDSPTPSKVGEESTKNRLFD